MGGFTEANAEKILSILKDKGWNAYLRLNDLSADMTSEDIAVGPAEKLEENSTYVFLPVTEDPKNSEQVFSTFESLCRKMSQQIPSASLHDRQIPMIGITLFPGVVKTHNPVNPEDEGFSYEGFTSILDTYTNAIENLAKDDPVCSCGS